MNPLIPPTMGWISPSFYKDGFGIKLLMQKGWTIIKCPLVLSDYLQTIK